MWGRPRVVAVASVVALLAVAASAASAQAAFPGRNGLIAVHTFRGDDVQMWVIRPDGTGLTRFPVYGEGAFSPDGRRFALSTGRKLTLTDLNGRLLQTIETRYNGKRLFVSEPAWSPAADRIYFGTDVDGHFAVPVGGGEPQPLGRGGMALDVSVTGRVAYEVDRNAYGDTAIYTSEANGGDVRRLGNGSSPSWSPDGSRLAFIGDDAIFYVASADGSVVTPLPNVNARNLLYLAWSPDGTEMAVVRTADADRLAVVNVATGAIRQLFSARKINTDLLYGIGWQPLQGDDQIVLPQAPRPGRCDLPGARTLHKTKRVRIFTENDKLYGCLYATGRIVKLTQGGDERLGEVALAGRFVGFEIESDGPDDGPYADLFVQNLRTGRVKRETNSVDPSSGFFYADVRKLVMTRKGAIAWVVRPYSNKGNFKPLPLLQVQKLDRNGPRLLDAGTGIKTSSFKLTQHRITWRHGNARRSAILH